MISSNKNTVVCLCLAVFSLSLASPIQNRYTPEGGLCRDYDIPVTVTSKNYPWIAPKWSDNFGFVDLLSAGATRSTANFPLPLGAPESQTASHQISGTFCRPKKQGKYSKTVLLATHGLGFDRSYWNSPYKPEKYNFAEYALARGYSIFYYDRLGVGRSSKISGFDNQLSIQVAILSALTDSIRQGHYTDTLGIPTSIVLVGHSFGSYVSGALAAVESSIADAIVLTGYSLSGGDARVVLEGFGPRVANLQGSDVFCDFDSGYLTTVDIFASINNFYKAPLYEHDVAEFAEKTKQPFAIAEALTLPLAPTNIEESNFTSPALVISGEFDFIVCGGYCPGVLEEPAKQMYANSRHFESYSQPGTGHALNLAKNATGSFDVIFGFLEKNGL